MKYLLSILCFSILISEDIYPHFTDMTKQLEFERKRIYIEDKSGERIDVSGGESYSEMANPLGYIFLGQDPDHISKNTPIVTKYEYWSVFAIIQNNKKLSEIEFLKTIGLMDEANTIFKDYNDRVKNYETKINEPHTKLIIRPGRSANAIGEDAVSGIGLGLLSWGLGSLIWNDYGSDGIDTEASFHTRGDAQEVVLIGGIFLATHFLMKNKNPDTFKREPDTTKVISYPDKNLKRPTMKQTLSNEQITSLADAYNRKLYNDINNK